MKIKKIKTLDYQYGDEEKIKQILYNSKEPILLKIKDFPDTFTLDYFAKIIKEYTTYEGFENGQVVSHEVKPFPTVISEIQEGKPYRIFGQLLDRRYSREIEKYVPLWQSIPFRPRYFKKILKVVYFFGGVDSRTSMHFDREHCSNLHLCLSGKKQMLLFTEAQSDYLYKFPFVGDSLIDFAQPMDAICKQFPKAKQAEGYNVLLEKGDMLFMPRNCWHYTTYLEASSGASYIFYPKKFHQIYGYFTGKFYMAYRAQSGLGIFDWPIFSMFSHHYALANGKTKSFLKVIESILFVFLLPIICVCSIISYTLRPRTPF